MSENNLQQRIKKHIENRLQSLFDLSGEDIKKICNKTVEIKTIHGSDLGWEVFDDFLYYDSFEESVLKTYKDKMILIDFLNNIEKDIKLSSKGIKKTSVKINIKYGKSGQYLLSDPELISEFCNHLYKIYCDPKGSEYQSTLQEDIIEIQESISNRKPNDSRQKRLHKLTKKLFSFVEDEISKKSLSSRNIQLIIGYILSCANFIHTYEWFLKNNKASYDDKEDDQLRYEEYLIKIVYNYLIRP